LDAASTSRKIDDMRELIESVMPLPNYSKYKVYILDESHMLTQDSANAFLKTLEEPPSHVIFMLCTTNPEKIISTVRSRCTLINLKTPDTKDIITNLNRIIKGEKIDKIDKEILEVVAKHSNHSFRDSVVLLEKLIQNKDEITIDLIQSLVGISNIEIVNEVIEAIIKKDIDSIIKLTTKANFDFSYSNFLNAMRDGILHRFKHEGKGILKDDLLNAIDKDVEIAKFFTSANLLYFLEKEDLWNRCKDKGSALIAIVGNYLESVK
jgi:DNA polymerase-3 subunit gamma/tau